MRLTILFALLASPAAAHPGHLADLAGHDHWVGAAAIGLAAAIALWGVLKDKSEETTTEDDAPEGEEQTA